MGWGKATHLAIAAHMDDIEIMAVDGILKAQADPELRFAGVVVTDSKGGHRAKGGNSQMSQTKRWQRSGLGGTSQGC